MESILGVRNRVLEIDLSKRDFKEIGITEEDRQNYLGGKGLALKLLYDRLKPGIDPLGEENIFIVTTGVLIGTGAPNSSRFSAVSKSPLTGIKMVPFWNIRQFLLKVKQYVVLCS